MATDGTTDRRLAGARTLVTGASSGIGNATARLFAREGAAVAVAARREERLEQLAADIEAECGPDADVLVAPTDVSDPGAVEELVSGTVDAFGGLDVVVSNAGIVTPSAVEEVDDEEYRRLMGVNVDGSFYVARAALPHLRASSGNLVFVGSYAGTLPFPRNPLYGASKWWLTGFALSLSGVVGDDGVAVSVVNPAEVRTEIGGGYREPNIERFEPGQITEAADVAEAIGFAARQDPPNAVTELNLFRRNKYSNLAERSAFPDPETDA